MSNQGMQPQADRYPERREARLRSIVRRFRIGLEQAMANGQRPRGAGDLGRYIDGILDDWVSGDDRDYLKANDGWGLEQMAKDVKRAMRRARLQEGSPRDAGLAAAIKSIMRRNPGVNDPDRIAGALMAQEVMVTPDEVARIMKGPACAAKPKEKTMVERRKVREAEKERDEDEEDDEVAESELVTQGMGKTEKPGDGTFDNHEERGASGHRHLDGETPVQGTGEKPKCGSGSKGGSGDAYSKPGYSTSSGPVGKTEGGHSKSLDGTALKGLKKESARIVSRMLKTASPERVAAYVIETIGPAKARRLAEHVRGARINGAREFSHLVEAHSLDQAAEINRLVRLIRR